MRKTQKKLPIRIFALFAAMTIAFQVSSQNRMPDMFVNRTEQQVIDMLNNGGFTVKKTLPAIPDSLAGHTLVCNGYKLIETNKSFQDMEFIKFTSNSFSNPIKGDFEQFLTCNTIKYVFQADMVLVPCIIFVCNTGMSIYVYIPETSLLPSAFLVYFPPNGSDNLQLFATFRLTGKLAPVKETRQVSSFAIQSSGSSYSSTSRTKSDNEISIEYYSACSKFIYAKDAQGLVNFIKNTPLPNKFYDSEYTFDYPLMLAVEEKNIEIVKALLEMGADPNIKEEVPGDDNLSTAEVFDILNRDTTYPEFGNIVKLLCDNGLDLYRAMLWSIINDNMAFMDLFARLHAEWPQFTDARKASLLSDAVTFNNVPAAQWLIEKGADPNFTGNGESPLQEALKSKDKEIKSYFKKMK